MMNDTQGVTAPALRQFCVLQAWFLLPLLLVLGCVLLLCAVTGATPDALFIDLQAQFPGLHVSMRLVSRLGNKVFYGMYAGLFLWAVWRGQWRYIALPLAYLFVQVAVTAVLVQGTKVVVGRTRPYVVEQGFHFFSTRNAFHSFPSGHTAEITGATAPLGHSLGTPLWCIAFGVFPALMGFSRMLLREHHMLDVLGGALVGSFSAWCMLALAPVLHRSLQRFPLFYRAGRSAR